MKRNALLLNLVCLFAALPAHAEKSIPLYACEGETSELSVIILQEEATGDFYAVKEGSKNARPERLTLRDAQGQSFFSSAHFDFRDDFSKGAETALAEPLHCSSLEADDDSGENALKPELAAYSSKKSAAKKSKAKRRRVNSYEDQFYYPSRRTNSYEGYYYPSRRTNSYEGYYYYPSRRVNSYGMGYEPAKRSKRGKRKSVGSYCDGLCLLE